VTEGIPRLRGGVAAYRATGSDTWMPYFMGLLARAYELAGQIERLL
jgi:hypothetical protein